MRPRFAVFAILATCALRLATAQHPPASSGTPWDPKVQARVRSMTPALVIALAELADSQTAYRASHSAYALRPFGKDDAAVDITVLWADATGWRAIATDRATPGFLCAMIEGAAAADAPFDSAPPPHTALCGWPPHGLFKPDTTPVVATTTRPPREVRPRSNCPEMTFSREARSRLLAPQSLVTSFVLDTLGQPQPETLSIRGGLNFWGTVAAIEMVELCRFRPAQVDGRHVRVLVNVPVNLRP